MLEDRNEGRKAERPKKKGGMGRNKRKKGRQEGRRVQENGKREMKGRKKKKKEEGLQR